MCGIAGIAGEAGFDHQLLERMAASMALRGPDGHGIWRGEGVGLAHTRLRVIDLSPASDQPMSVEHLRLVYNGEIYNYRELRTELEGLGHAFTSNGDTEVLLRAWLQWGEAALERLNGMFAFALWDDERRSLTIARDRFGEKPLYFARAGERVVFASQLRTVLLAGNVAGRPDDGAIGAYLARGVMPMPDRSFATDVERLPAAHVLTWEHGQTSVRRYWLPDAGARSTLAYEDAVERLRELLLDSISLRLRSDVPIGTSLSGGVDSSTIVGLSARLAGDHRRHAFTARFPGFELDEWDYAASVAGAAELTTHHAVEPTAAGLASELDAFVRDQDEPVGSTSVYAQYCVMRAASEAGVTVLLDGQGADEGFCGYAAGVGRALRVLGPAAVLRALGDREARSALLQTLAVDRLPGSAKRVLRRRRSSPYASKAVVAAGERIGPPYAPLQPDLDRLRREQLEEMYVTVLPDLLRYGDRSSMAFSRELRLPFLDHRIVEFALSLPASYLYRNGVTKRVLRDAARDSVPDSVLARRDKIAYQPPQRRWLESPELRDRIGAALLDRDARTESMIERAAIERDLRAASWRDPDAIWRALNLELWMREIATVR